MDADNELHSPSTVVDNVDDRERSAVVSGLGDVALSDEPVGQSQRAVKFADEVDDVHVEDDETDGRPSTSLTDLRDASSRDEGSTRHGTAELAQEGGDDRPQTDSSNSTQKRSFKPKKTFDFENGDTALSEIDRQGNMDGHCEYKFYTGATFSGKMRHGERSGPALLVKHTGERWEINYRHNKIKGAATLLCPNGDRVSGTFVSPSWDGAIVCQFGDGSRFDGVWDYPWPMITHTGTLRYSDGSEYVGAFVGRHPHGVGSLIMANGRGYSGEFVCSIRHGIGSYVFNTAVDADASFSNDGHTESSESRKSEQSSRKLGLPSEDSAAGLFVHNSFICGAVARALRGTKDAFILPTTFGAFFRAFWGQQQLLVDDGVQLPGHVNKFLPILETVDPAAGCTSMWTLAFDGGAPAACHAAAAAIARAPFCGRYIQEVDHHAQDLFSAATAEMEACVKDPHLFFPAMKPVCDAATIRLPVLPPPSILDREALSAAVAAAAAVLMQGVRDCDVEGARRMGREDGHWPWRYGGNWVQDCRHGVGAYSDNSGQLFVGIWDRDIPVTGAGFMHRHAGDGSPGGEERLLCGAVHPTVPKQKLPVHPDSDARIISKAAPAITSKSIDKTMSIQQSLPSAMSPAVEPLSSAALITMMNPPHWLPSEISLLHLGSGWSGHGGSVDKLPPPSSNFSDPLRIRCAHVPPACQMAEPLSWSPLEDERLAIEAVRAAEIKAAELAEAIQRNIDAERRAAAKKRLQVAGSKVAKGLGRDAESSTPESRDNVEIKDCVVEHDQHEPPAADDDGSETYVTEAEEAFADAGGSLSEAEVGSFACEGGWYCGTVANNMRHGRGIMLCSSGSSYSGEWCNDTMHGFGQLLLASGSTLSGCWWKGRMHGLCRHISRRDGSTFEGCMVHGERRGRGKLTFAWADVYEGELARDLPNGNGIMYTSAGDTIRGVFKDCEPVGAGDGIKVLPDGRRFTGTLLDGRPHGKGLVDKNGTQAECTFDEGAFVCYNIPTD